ncbi:MAG TPA: response regulator transcription factor [Gemmatimonadales bacterium]|nr:response regulator transcription factor [Gemmatimonadales bacterium]
MPAAPGGAAVPSAAPAAGALQPERRNEVRVFVVESDTMSAQDLRTSLELAGYTVEVARDHLRARLQAPSFKPHLMLLSGMLLEASGFQLLNELRSRPDIPVLILGLHVALAESIPGFRLGFDDFLVRPFTALQLHWHVRELLERSAVFELTVESFPADPPIRFGTVAVNPLTHEVHHGGVEVKLRPREFDLLMALIRRNGRVATRHELLSAVWGYDTSVVSRTLDTHVTTLRQKLEDDPEHPRHILTVRKVGYRFEP